MAHFRRRIRYRFQSKPRPRRQPFQWKKAALPLILSLLIFSVLGIEKRLGPLAQDAALSVLNGQLMKEINLTVTQVLEQENINAGSILQEEKDDTGTIENIVTDYAAANRVKTAIAVRIQEKLEGYRTVYAYVPIGALFSDTLLTGFGIPIPVRAFATHMIDIQFHDTFDSAGINQTRQQLSLEIKVPIRISGIFSYRDAVVSTEVPLAESVIIGTVPQTYLNAIPD